MMGAIHTGEYFDHRRSIDQFLEGKVDQKTVTQTTYDAYKWYNIMDRLDIYFDVK